MFREWRLYILLLPLLCALVLHAGQACAQQNSKQKRIDSLQASLLNAKKETDKILILIALYRKSNCGDSLLRIQYIKQALELSEKNHWQKGLFESYRLSGDLYQNCLKNDTEAIKAYEKALQTAKQMNDTALTNKALQESGLLYKDMGHYALALDCFYKIIQSKPNNSVLMSTWANIGAINNSLGDYAKALGPYEKALKILDETKNSNEFTPEGKILMQAGLLTTIADIYIATGDYDKAISNYESVLNNNKQINAPNLACYGNKGIGQCYLLNKKEIEKAIPYFEKALGIVRENKTGDFKGYEEDILNEMAEGYLQMGNTEKALSYARQSMSVALRNNNKPQLAKTYATLGKIYYTEKEYAHAINYLQNAISIANETGAKDDEKNAWEALSASYTATRQTDKAFAAYKNFIAIRDSVYNVDKAKQLTQMDMQGEFDRKQATESVKLAEEKKIVDLRIQKQRMLIYSGFGGVALMILLAFFVYRNYNNEKKANAVISQANETIKLEKEVSENLLLNILPANVAEELKVHGDVQAKQFDNVTVLFSDFVSFTTASERLTPQELVAELHACFKAFDGIVGKYNIEKIKTVGDAYLAVAGLPELNANHAADMINAAMEIRDFMVDRKKQLGHLTFGIRLGLNSGSVVAGIVGVKKFAYDIWGDTVNTAARMEQNSEDGKINITEATYELVKDKFLCSYRGEIAAKNKGMLKMYFVEGRLIL